MKLFIASDIHGSAFWCRRLCDVIEQENPDRIILLPGGRIFFVETKRPSGGSRGEMQKKWAQWLRRLGFAHLWIHTREEIADFERLIVYERI